ncbi:MAG: ion transporter [Pseudomonadota bacterium]
MADERPSLRRRLWRQLDPDAWPSTGLSPLNMALVSLVLLSALSASLLTEPSLAWLEAPLQWVLAVCAAVFTAEYPLRVWVKFESPRWRASSWGPLGWCTRWYAIIDLLALIGVWAELMFGATFGLAVILRLARLLRVFAAGDNTTFGRAAREIARAVRERRLELYISAAVAGLALMLASVAIYLAERNVQPEIFGSIPRAMWWAVVTLTTVGYGDATPVTAVGRVIGGFTALGSVALIAMPAGIMAAAFSDALQRARRRGREGER